MDDSKVIKYYVKDLNDYIEIVNKLIENSNHQYEFFYRGHYDSKYQLLPSSYRYKEGDNESVIYHQIISMCSNDFLDCQSNIERLTKMQHYECPTRLLDVTQNPLVALYFACENFGCKNCDQSDSAEVIIFKISPNNIKFYDSDTVSMLSAYAFLSTKDKRQLYNYIKNKLNCKAEKLEQEEKELEKFIHIIREDQGDFKLNIVIKDLIEPVIVITKKNNPRIIKQDGCFILSGITCDKRQTEKNIAKLRIKVKDLDKNKLNDDKKKYVRIIIDKDDRNKILKELDGFGIKKSTLFPEIDKVADYLKTKYK